MNLLFYIMLVVALPIILPVIFAEWSNDE